MADKMILFDKNIVNRDGDIRERVVYQRHMAEGPLLKNTLASDLTYYGITTIDTVGEAVAFGDMLFRESDSKYWIANAATTATMPGLVMAIEDISADASGLLLHIGYVRNDTWSWTLGGSSGLLYVSLNGITGNTLTQTVPSGAKEQVQVIGYATEASEIYFSPSLVLVEI